MWYSGGSAMASDGGIYLLPYSQIQQFYGGVHGDDLSIPFNVNVIP